MNYSAVLCMLRREKFGVIKDQMIEEKKLAKQENWKEADLPNEIESNHSD